MEAEEESVKDQNWLPRSIPALSKGEEFYPGRQHLQAVIGVSRACESQVIITYPNLVPPQLLEAPAGDFSSQLPCQHRANKLCS